MQKSVSSPQTLLEEMCASPSLNYLISHFKLKVLLIIILFNFIGMSVLSGQYIILYSDGSNNPLTTDAVFVCQDESFVNTIRIIVNSDDADNSTFTLNLPPGINYVPGCMEVIDSNPAIKVSEQDISDLNNPVFEIDPSDLSAGNELTIQYCRVADCEATDHIMTGGTFKDAIEVCGDDGCTSDIDPNLNSYDVFTPSVSMSSQGPVTAAVGENVCRTVTLTNGGQGYLDSLKYYIIDGPGTTTTGVTTIPSGTVLTPVVNGDTLCYWLTGALLAEFGDGDTFFENGEQVMLERCYDVDACDNASYYGAYWGCPGACMSTAEIMQQTNVPNLVPNLSFGFKDGVNRDFCFKGQNAANGGTAVMQTFEICNSGAGAATNLSFELHNNTPGSGTGQNYLSTDPVNVFDDTGAPIGTSSAQNSLYTGNYYQANCAVETHPRAVEFQFDGIIVAAGACITIEVPSYANNISETCDGKCNGDIAWYYFNRSYQYEDICGVSNYSQARAGIAYGGRQLYRYDIAMPTDMRDCDEFDLQVNYSNFYNNTKSTTEGSTELKIDVSNTGLLYQGTGTEVFKGVNVTVTQLGDTICVIYPHNAISNGSGQLTLPLKATCATGGGTKSINMWHEGQYDDNCPGDKYHLKCLSRTYQMHCPDPCPEGGATPTLFTLERTSLGLADVDNNGIPDGTGTANPADVELHRASNCDTVKGTWEIYVHPNTVGPNAGSPFNHLYVEFDLERINLNCTLFEAPNLFVPLPDAEATIYPADGSAPFTCLVTPTIEDTGTQTDDLAKYDLTGCKANWEGGDSIVFCANYVINTSYHSGGFNQYVANNEVYSSYTPNPTGVNPSPDNKYTCDHYNDYLNVYRHYFSPYTPTPQTINGCEGSLIYYLRYYINVQTGDVWYPNEYRPFTIPDKFIIELDDALAYRPGSVTFSGQPVPDSDITQMGNILTVCNLKQFFSSNGGPIQDPDETWNYNVRFNVDPTCDATPGLYNTRFKGQVIGNGCHSPAMNYTALQNCSATTGLSGLAQVNYAGPQPFLTGGGTVQYTTSQSCWDVILNNGSNNIDAPFTWFAFDGGFNYTLTDAAGAVILPDANGFYQLGDNPASNSATYTVCAQGSECDTTKINVLSGFGCTSYPDNMDGLSCAESVELLGLPLMSEVQIGFEEQPDPPMLLCETQNFELKMTSAQSAYLDDPRMSILVPPGATISNIMVEYPCESGNFEPAVTTVNGSLILIDVEAHSEMTAAGMPGTIDALAPAEREACITFDLDTDCDFVSSSGLVFQAFGNRPCGDPAINNGIRVRSSDLTISGVSQPHGASVSITASLDELRGCEEGNNVEVNVDFFSLGANFSSPSDSIIITLDPGVEFLPGTFACCSTNPNHCPTLSYVTTDASGFTELVLAFPATPMDLTMNPNMCFSYDVVNTPDNPCDNPGNMNVLVRASAGNVPCDTAPGGICPDVQTVTGSKDIEFTSEKIELAFSGPAAYECTGSGEITYDIPIQIDSMDVEAGDFLVLDIFCTTASGTPGTFVKSELINGPITAGTVVNITGSIPAGSCDPNFGISAVIGKTNNDGLEQCVCEDLILPSGPLECPAVISHSKSLTSITETAPGEWDVKWTVEVNNTGLGDGIYDLNDIPGFDDDIEICEAYYSTTDAMANPANPGPLMLALDGVYELAVNQMIAAGETNTYCLIVSAKYDPSAATALGDGYYTSCEAGTIGDPASGEGLYNESQLDVDSDGTVDEMDKVCADLPCDLSIVSAVPGPCDPLTSTFDLTVQVTYIAGPDCLMDIAGQTFVTDGSGNQTFTVPNLDATGIAGQSLSAYFTCEATCFDTGSYDAPAACAVLECETTTQVDILCNGEATGSATVTASGGTTPYAYSWNSVPPQTTATATALTAGTYTVTITDADDTETTCSVTITEPTELVCSTLKLNDISCNGLSDGSASVTPGGGTGVYSILWSSSEATSTAVNLSAGTNSVTITDSNNCEVICTVEIINPAVVSCTITSSTDPSCAGTATGSLTAAGTGGTGTLEYSVNGGAFQTGGNFTGLTAGTYTVTVKDVNECSSNCSVTLTDPAALSCLVVQNQPAACGMSSGQATVTANGGTPGYTYVWDNTETTMQATALSAGTHTVTVTDDNGCSTTCQVLISSTSGLTCEISSSTDVSCNGASDGAAVVTAMGGTTPYTYLWSTGATSAGIASVPGGTYTVTVTDDDGCSSVCSVVITEATELLCNLIKENDISCNGLSDGSATVTASGGTPGYTYLWTSGETTTTATMLGAGPNAVTVTDFDGCETVCPVTIVDPAAVSCAIIASTDPLCAASSTGTITVSGTGGTGTLEYSINGGAYQTGGNFTSLAAGSYTVTVKDANDCTSTCATTLTDPAVLTCTVVEDEPSACGMDDGEATVTATGGTGAYTYAWDNTETTMQATVLSPGTHTVTVTDANNCTTTCQVVITSPSGLTCEISSSTDVSCNGASDGEAIVAAMGGTTPYTYLWSTGATSAGIASVPGGTYTVTVTDDDGCSSVCSVVITEATELLCNLIKENDISCNGLSDGSATVTASGGTPGYTYLWTSGETTTTATMLGAGPNAVTVTDFDGCETVCPVTIIDPAAVSCAIIASTDPLCAASSTGTITVSGTGGTGTLEYSINGGAYQTGGNFTSLAAGSYTVTVKDANDCTSTCAATLTDPAVLTCTVVEDEPSACGMDDGEATVTATGGTGAYTYAWDNTETTIQATALSPGTHTVTVTDANNCTTTCQVVITSPSGLTCEISSSTDVSCNGASDGAAVVTAMGGTTPYTYLWSTGATSAGIASVPGGTYTVTVTDDDGCSSVCSVVITEATELLCNLVKENDISCNGLSDGSATVTASGGTPGYTYLWTSGETTTTATMLGAGPNAVTVTDFDGCETVCPVMIINPAAVSCAITASTDPLCSASSTGTITVSGTGGTGTLEYSINGGAYQTGGNFTGLAAGSYTVTVKDANDCTSTCAATLTDPAVLTCTVVEDEPSACGMDDGEATVTATGGTGAYTYAWDNTETTMQATALSPGTHTVTVTDANNCTTTCQVVITSPSGLTCEISSSTDVSCNGASDGAAVVTAMGGTTPYTYLWSTGATSAGIASVPGGTYAVTVTDDDGCSSVCSVVITEATELLCNLVKENDISCNGLTDGSATVTASGGTPGYTYLWTSGETTTTATMLGAGPNAVTVTDFDGCETVCPVMIIEPAVVSCAITASTDPLCAASSTGTITVSGTGGTGTLEYSINGGAYQTGGNFTGLAAGSYTVTVKDANECTSTCAATLTDPAVLACTVVEDEPSACGMDDGEATVTATGGTGAYTYAWDNTETTMQATALSPGTHTVTVTDANNCTTTCQVVITSPSGLTCEISSSTNVSCNGASDGAAVVTAMGGTTPYTYLWSTGATSAGIASVPGGTYTVTVTDGDGCSVECSVVLEEASELLCNLVKENDISCNGLTDGSATVTASGGSPGYTYLWSSGETTTTAAMLVSGPNTVTVTDADGCETVCTVSIIDPPAVICTVTMTTNPSCNGTSTGFITVSGSGGTGSLEYSINGGIYQAGGNFSGLTDGNHTVTVRDENGCSSTCSAILTDPAVLACTVVEDEPSACGMDDGKATVTATGGTGAYTYAWDNTETTMQAVALSPGVHTVTVSDANGCLTTCQVVISSPNALTCEITSSTDVSCNGASDGSAIVTPTGGTTPYTYAWSTGSTFMGIASLPGGSYTVTVTDNDGCTAVCSVDIEEANALVCNVVKLNDITCNGLANGSAEASVSGGVPGYTYIWSTGETTPIASALVFGDNYVTITDNDNCTIVCSANITQPDPLTCTLSMTPTECQGQSNGTISTSVSGGTAPFMYAINGGINQTGAVFQNLPEGAYSVEVTDANGCTTNCLINVEVTGCQYDLSLVKKLAPGETGMYDPGDNVTFRITVCNQGQIAAEDFEITDYIPFGLSFNALNGVNSTNGWNLVGANAVTQLSVLGGQLTSGGLLPATCMDVDIVLTVASNAPQGMSIINFAEISNDDGDDIDSMPDGNDTNDGPAEDNETMNNNSDEDDHDPEEIMINFFDLALTKSLATGQAPNVAPGDDVTYTITVYNQGTIAADNIELTDYVPACMTNVDPLWTGPATGPVTHTMSTANMELPTGGLAPGDFAQFNITLNLNTTANSSCDLTNYSEISDDTDSDGMPIDDIDSMTDGMNNDVVGGDDITDDTNGDEDDHDPATVGLLEYDLALTKDLAMNQPSAVAPGDFITYDITVINQGQVNAMQVEVTDYIPECMTLADPDWTATASGNDATYLMTIPNDIPVGGIPPNGSASVQITVQLDNPVGSTCDLTNYAEISGDDGEDNDSDPDGDDSNDPPGEDDIDDVGIDLLEFDLALSKDLAQNQAPAIAPGDDITFTITVTNQGEIYADNIEITDYLPACTSLNDPSWNDLGTTATYTMLAGVDFPTGGLAPMATASVDIVLKLDNPLAAGCDMTNWSEISDATDEEGMPQDDRDSDPNNNPNDDPPGEDDIDEAPFEVLEFDLALSKTLAVGQSNEVMPGDNVTYTFTIFNQGEIYADNIEISDYIPAHFALNDVNWVGPNPAVTTLTVAANELPTGGLPPGGMATVDITLTVLMTAVEGDTYVNVGEISDATDEDGMTQDDTDSDPDDNPINDPNGEDDIDEVPVIIMGNCDLALRKTCSEFLSNGDGTGGQMVFEFEIINQGSCPAYNVGLVDYILPGLTLNDPTWFSNPFNGFAYYTHPTPILGGTTELVTITFDITDFDPNNPYTNWAEITGSEDFNNDPQEDTDSTPDYNPINDGPPVDDEVDNNFNDEDDHDYADICIMDLAIDKSLDPSMMPPYAYGDDIIFNICVTNEGNMTASSITVADHIPAGFTFDPVLNTNWNGVAPTVTHTFTGAIAPGDVVCESITLKFVSGGTSTADYTNVTEITEVFDEDGSPENDDWDSTPNNDDGDQSEDDEDKEVFRVFDLALTKTTTDIGPFSYGQDVIFDVNVYNQGSIPAHDVELVDYIPCGYEFVNNGVWSLDANGNAVTVHAGPIMPGNNISIPITMKIKPCATQGAWENFAEITAADDEFGMPGDDIDSNPNADNTDDGPSEDNDIDGTNGDEDDHDPELIDIFDLALTKTIDNRGPYLPGDVVEFKIRLFNQGNQAAANVVVTDYLNTGFIFTPGGINAGWTSVGAYAEYTYAGPLLPGVTDSISLFLEITIPAGASLDSWTNEAEISEDNADDADSYANNDPDDDNDVVPGDDNDDETDEHVDDPFNEGDDDEDDNDVADVLVTGEIGDQVWKDLDGNGIQDAGEPGLANVIVNLYDCNGVFLETTTTDSQGNYLFDLLLPGSYQLNFDISNLPNSCAFTYQGQGTDAEDSDVDINGDTACIDLDAGEMNHDVDAGLIPLAKLGDTVWHDCDGDGTNNGEQGISGIKVELYQSNGQFVDLIYTNASGNYLFDNLYPGDYYVKFSAGGYTFTDHGQGGNGNNDSDVDGSQGVGTTAIVNLSPGECDLNSFDAGLYTCVALGERLWFDYIENDIWDPTENGINGLKVQAYKFTNNAWVLYDETYTGHKPGTPSDDGYFKFCVPPGKYYLKFDNPPSQLAVVTPNVGSDDNIDSDVTGAFGSGTTNEIVLTCGSGNCSIGAGYYNIAASASWINVTGEHKFSHNEFEWEALEDAEVSHYEIERAANGTDAFEFVTKILANDINGHISTYNFEDYDIYDSEIYTYRVRQIRMDQSMNTSQALTLTAELIDSEIEDSETEDEDLIKVYPNPVVNELTIEIDLKKDVTDFTADIYDASGQLIRKNALMDIDLKPGVRKYKINMFGLENGVYSVQFLMDEMKVNKRIIIISQ